MKLHLLQNIWFYGLIFWQGSECPVLFYVPRKPEFRTLWGTALNQWKKAQPSLLVSWVSLLSFLMMSFMVLSRVIRFGTQPFWSQWHIISTYMHWVLWELNQHFYNGFKITVSFLPSGSQLAAWNQEPIPWGGGMACSWECWNYCDAL